MVASRVYLDHNASAPLRPAARSVMLAALDSFANPSSVHTEGRTARRAVEDARRAIAALVNADPANVVFTSGATEAASWLLRPNWRMGRAPLEIARLIVCAADHPVTLGGGQFPAERVKRIGVDGDGLLRLDELQAALGAKDQHLGVTLVAMHLANNETGVIQSAREIAAMTKAAGAVIAFDAVQAAGRIELDIEALGADFLLLSSHKLGGPKGAGALVSAGVALMPEPLVRGGGQERGHRAGTENLPAIAGFGAAAVEAAADLSYMVEVAALRDRFEQAVTLAFDDAVILGASAPRLPNTLFFAVPGMKAETMQIAFDLAGVSLSAGSACSSGKVGPSHVLEAMGFGNLAGALRVSIGRETGEAGLLAFTTALRSIVARRTKGQAA